VTLSFCTTLHRRAWDLTDADVIRLGCGQGSWDELQGRRGRVEVRGTWREVLGVYRDREALTAAQDPEAGGRLDKLADKAFEDSHNAMIIQVCLHELSDPGMIDDLFMIVRQVDMIEVQSLPVPGLERRWDLPPDPAREFVLAVAGNAIVADDFPDGNQVFNAVVRDAREVAAGLGLSYEPGEGREGR
jgi:hypothetical protein